MRLFIALLLATVSAKQFSYEGYKVYRVQPSGEDQLESLAHLAYKQHFDFWTPLRRDGQPTDIMVAPSAQKLFQKFLESNTIAHDVLIDNVENLVQEERKRQLLTNSLNPGRISFEKYHRHGEMNAYLDQLAIEYPQLVTLENIGKSYEGRNMTVIKISTDSSANKPIIFIDAGIHAVEWAAPTVALYAINQLVENPENSHLLEKVDWHILPVLNPDGYEYTHTKRRLWRKTLSPGVKCNGTDGNRNFDFHWAEIGSSNDECTDDYHGKSAFSEPEMVALRDYILKNKNDIKLYLTFHSFGSLILYPWGYTTVLPENSDELQALGEEVARSIRDVAGENYRVGSSTNILYPAAGGSDDWVKGVAGIELAYTIELPRGGLIGFDPPPWRILPIVTETWEGLKTYHNYISNKFG